MLNTSLKKKKKRVKIIHLFQHKNKNFIQLRTRKMQSSVDGKEQFGINVSLLINKIPELELRVFTSSCDYFFCCIYLFIFKTVFTVSNYKI